MRIRRSRYESDRPDYHDKRSGDSITTSGEYNINDLHYYDDDDRSTSTAEWVGEQEKKKKQETRRID